MIFDEKRRFHTKQDLYCQNKVIKTEILLAKSRFSNVIICATKMYRSLNAKKLFSYFQSFRRQSEYIEDI